MPTDRVHNLLPADGEVAGLLAASATSIGNCRLVRSKPMTTSKIRLRITQAPVCPAISERTLFLEPTS